MRYLQKHRCLSYIFLLGALSFSVNGENEKNASVADQVASDNFEQTVDSVQPTASVLYNTTHSLPNKEKAIHDPLNIEPSFSPILTEVAGPALYSIDPAVMISDLSAADAASELYSMQEMNLTASLYHSDLTTYIDVSLETSSVPLGSEATLVLTSNAGISHSTMKTATSTVSLTLPEVTPGFDTIKGYESSQSVFNRTKIPTIVSSIENIANNSDEDYLMTTIVPFSRSGPILVTTEILLTSENYSDDVNYSLATATDILLQPEDAMYKIIFHGNCSVLKENKYAQTSFEDKLVTQLSAQLVILAERIVVGEIVCGSVITEIMIKNTTFEESLDEKIAAIVSKGNLTVIMMVDNVTFIYEALVFEVISSPGWRPTPTPTHVIGLREEESGLQPLHIALILLGSVVLGSALLFGIGFGVYACCTNQRSKTFSLMDMPPHAVVAEDFTLTKMERPTPLYGDDGIVLQPDAGTNSSGMLPVNSALPTHGDSNSPLAAARKHNGFFPKTGPKHTNNRYEKHLNRRVTPSPIKFNIGSTENLVISRHIQLGYDNPSFSSDSLDSSSDIGKQSQHGGSSEISNSTECIVPNGGGTDEKQSTMAPITNRPNCVSLNASPGKRQSSDKTIEAATAF